MAMSNIKVKSESTSAAISELNQLAMDSQVLLRWIPAHKGYDMMVTKRQTLLPNKVLITWTITKSNVEGSVSAACSVWVIVKWGKDGERYKTFKADHKHVHKNLELYEVWINIKKLLYDDPSPCIICFFKASYYTNYKVAFGMDRDVSGWSFEQFL